MMNQEFQAFDSPIHIGNMSIVLVAVGEILDDLYLEGWSPGDPGLLEALSKGLREAGNHLSPGMESACAAALGEVFSRFCREQTGTW